jgi:adenylate kinase
MPWCLDTFSIVTCIIFQEILDEIVDIDLVLNFKCADNCFMKKRCGGDICTHCGQLFDVSSSRERNLSLRSPTWHPQAQPAALMGLDNSRMEKMRAYAEQVFSASPTLLNPHG